MSFNKSKQMQIPQFVNGAVTGTTTVTGLPAGGTPLDTDLLGGDRSLTSVKWSMAAIKAYCQVGTVGQVQQTFQLGFNTEASVPVVHFSTTWILTKTGKFITYNIPDASAVIVDPAGSALSTVHTPSPTTLPVGFYDPFERFTARLGVLPNTTNSNTSIGMVAVLLDGNVEIYAGLANTIFPYAAGVDQKLIGFLNIASAQVLPVCLSPAADLAIDEMYRLKSIGQDKEAAALLKACVTDKDEVLKLLSMK